MASTSALPQPSRPASNPPTAALPPLPPSKARKTLSVASDLPRASSPARSTPTLRPPSSPHTSLPKSPLSSSSTNLAALRSVSTGRTPASPEKNLRRTISIAAFPQPPKPVNRPSTASSVASVQSARRPSLDSDRAAAAAAGRSASARPKKSARISSGTANSYRGSKTPSLLNGSGDGKSILSEGVRDGKGHFSMPSPPHSRSSSAQGSYSTSATTFDDAEDGAGASKGNGKSKEAKGNVIVSVRARPDAGGAEHTRGDIEFHADGRRSLISYRGKEGGDYYYDNVFTSHDNNARVYDAAAKRLVRRVMEGYHGTVFAYGMTGTGKTFSMQGTATSPGVIPLAITDIFSFIRETPHREFLLRVSYLEIYNEKIHDLLSAPPGGNGVGFAQQEEIKLREDSKRGVYATPLKEEIVQSPTQLLRVIARGDHARRTASTQFNARSSRSHAVVQIVVESRERVPAGSATQDKRSAIVPGGVRVSTLSLIDLAGSERAADDKERRTEGAHINKSLLTLGNIISKLSEGKDKNGNPTDREGKHLPYRDSKLTRLLQPALSGNSLVSILCTVYLGSSGNAGETLNTLKFAARAKNNIVSHAKRAEESLGGGSGDPGSRVLLERYRMEIQSLRGQLESQAKMQAEKESKLEEQQIEKEAQARHEEQVLEMQLARTALKERIEHLNRLILSSKSTGVNSQSNLSALGRLSRATSIVDSGTRSLRSSASQSTLGANGHFVRPISHISVTSNDPYAHMSLGHDDDEDTVGEFGDGRASLQRQIMALQADLSDKNRYISTLERRLLQARRSSHSRMSIGIKTGNISSDNPEVVALLREKDMEINELRLQLDDKDRMLTALRSAARHRDAASVTAEPLTTDFTDRGQRGSMGSDGAPHVKDTPREPLALTSPATLSPVQPSDKEIKRKSVDEVSRMLDEMIQDRVEHGHLIKGSRGSVRLSSETRRESTLGVTIPGLNAVSPRPTMKIVSDTPEEPLGGPGSSNL